MWYVNFESVFSIMKLKNKQKFRKINITPYVEFFID